MDAPVFAIAVLKSLAHETEVDVPYQLSGADDSLNLIFQPGVVEQRFRAGVLTHHER